MSEIDDGVIKFDQRSFVKTPPLKTEEYILLEKWRETLYKLKLIGEYEKEKIGYGNISLRQNYLKIFQTDKSQFLITGTQTGKFPNLNGQHYARVIDYSFQKNKLIANGPIQASSEGLTHAAIYEASSEIKAVFHIHHLKTWEEMLKNNYPSTAKNIPYGSVEMAKATTNLVQNTSYGLFAMAGHREGIFSYGRSLDEAGQLILEIYHKFNS